MSIKKVDGHIDAIERKLGKAIKIAEKGNDLKLGDAIKLGRKTNSIVAELKKSSSEYDGTDPTADEATAIAKKMEKIVDMLETQLDLLIKDKPRIDELHVGGLVKSSLAKSQEAGAEFAKLCLEKAPEDMKPSAEALEERRNKAFDKAIAAYANASGGEDKADEGDDSD